LRDPSDEMVLETAVNGRANLLITFNVREYGTAPARFGIEVMTPREAKWQVGVRTSWDSPRNSPFSHSARQTTISDRRRRPAATAWATCSSKSSLSISALSHPSGDEFAGLRQHALQRFKIRVSVLRQSCLDLFREGLGVIDSGLDPCLWPFEESGNGKDVALIALNQKHYFPHR